MTGLTIIVILPWGSESDALTFFGNAMKTDFSIFYGICPLR